MPTWKMYSRDGATIVAAYLTEDGYYNTVGAGLQLLGSGWVLIQHPKPDTYDAIRVPVFDSMGWTEIGEYESPIYQDVIDGVFNVVKYGAIGDGIANDTSAILSAKADAEQAGPHSVLLFPGRIGYKTDTPITILGNVAVIMHSPIIFAGSGAPALTLGAAVGSAHVDRQMKGHSRIKVKRLTTSLWDNESDIGVQMTNLYYCTSWIDEAIGFTIGVQCRGDGAGFAYNEIHLGSIQNNHIGVDLSAYNVGWVNQNKFFGGSWNINSILYDGIGDAAKDRIGVRLGLGDSTYLNNNNNVFEQPSFEIYGRDSALFKGIPIQIKAGSVGNEFLKCRNEGCDPITPEISGTALPVKVTMNYDDYSFPSKPDEQGTYAGTIVERAYTGVPDSAKRLIFKADGLHKRACYANGSTTVNVPGLAIRTNGTTADDARSNTGLAIYSDYLEIGTTRMLGIYMSTRRMKRFVCVADQDGISGASGRFAITPYDSAGNVLTAAGTVRNDRSTYTYQTSFGGNWMVGSDNLQDPRLFVVSDATDYVFIGIRGGSNVAKVRSFSIYALDADAAPSTWLPWQDNGCNYGSAAPTIGTWETGRRIYIPNPTAGGIEGYVCITAGTPGTWKTFGSIGM